MGEANEPQPNDERSMRVSSRGASTRFDPPHVPNSNSEVDESSSRASDFPATPQPDTAPGFRIDERPDPGGGVRAILQPPLALALARYRRQAEQLADLLRMRQRELDRREARDNAQFALFEQEVRAARLWWDERSAEVAEQNAVIEGRSTALAALAAQLEARAAELADGMRSLNDRAERLAVREARFADWLATRRSFS